MSPILTFLSTIFGHHTKVLSALRLSSNKTNQRRNKPCIVSLPLFIEYIFLKTDVNLIGFFSGISFSLKILKIQYTQNIRQIFLCISKSSVTIAILHLLGIEKLMLPFSSTTIENHDYHPNYQYDT